MSEKVTAAVKESLLGSELTTNDVQITAQSKETFEKVAKKDAETGELYMGEQEFVDVVAPIGEDYVSSSFD